MSKRIVFLSCFFLLAYQSKGQFNYSYTDDKIPVTGGQYGFFYGETSAMLLNTDDANSKTIKQKLFNRSYFLGAERIQWFTPFFGFGQQALLWCGGASYKGVGDNSEFDAETELLYFKIPALFWWKSYSRWHPDRKLRANTFFGPFVALTFEGDEAWTTYDGAGNPSYHSLSTGKYEVKNDLGDVIFNGNADDGSPVSTFDYGFTMGAGIEYRLWRRTVVAIMIRSDVGLTDVENKDFEVTNAATGERYAFYKNITSKFSVPTSVNSQLQDFNRSETRNFGYGIQLSIRKYLGAK